MSDDLTPHDPFADGLGDRMHAAASHVDGAGVTLGGIEAAAGRSRRHVRTRAVVTGIAAAVVVLGGLAAVSTARDGGTQHVAAGPTTTTDPCPAATEGTAPTDPVGWIRLTVEQAQALQDAGLAAPSDELPDEQTYLITVAGLRVLDHDDIGPIGQQLWDMNTFDPDVLEHLTTGDLLTQEQAQSIEQGTSPVLDQGQIESLMAWSPDLLGVPAGGGPLKTEATYVPAGEDGPDMLTQEQVAAVVEYERSLQGSTDDPGSGGRERCGPVHQTDTTEADSGPSPTTTAPATTTTTAEVTPNGGGTWIVYLYILSGRRNGDGSITTALERMGENEPDQAAAAEAARRAASAKGLEVFEGDLACDPAVGEALGLDPELGHLGISVGFRDETTATVFAAEVRDDGVGVSAPVFVPFSCEGRPDPA